MAMTMAMAIVMVMGYLQLLYLQTGGRNRATFSRSTSFYSSFSWFSPHRGIIPHYARDWIWDHPPHPSSEIYIAFYVFEFRRLSEISAEVSFRGSSELDTGIQIFLGGRG
ncbi:hypothetical protein PVAG01_07286 [Phlyctema vagabunda]|uniref:Secreted protein n=1 Tax=Phlyctema vagabunda TaxID=108571 RepID=A0ABR4PBY8_9HELO